MISINDLSNIICTEALEHSGVQEVPDEQYGSTSNYHSEKRNAREVDKNSNQQKTEKLTPIRFRLELVEVDGKLKLLEN